MATTGTEWIALGRKKARCSSGGASDNVVPLKDPLNGDEMMFNYVGARMGWYGSAEGLWISGETAAFIGDSSSAGTGF